MGGSRFEVPERQGFQRYHPTQNAGTPLLGRSYTAAAEIGSINTVKNDEHALTGFNTDGVGALNAMQAAGIRPEGRSVLLLGAGGAARVIAYALAGRGCQVEIANRTVSNARRLAKSLYAKFGRKMKVVPLSKTALKNSVSQAEIILNASSMGMDGKHNPPIDERWIRGDHCVFDLVYRPVRTKLLRDALSAGAKTVTGLDMLVNQGACSFALWTGKKAPIGEMRRAVAKKLSSEIVTNR